MRQHVHLPLQICAILNGFKIFYAQQQYNAAFRHINPSAGVTEQHAPLLPYQLYFAQCVLTSMPKLHAQLSCFLQSCQSPYPSCHNSYQASFVCPPVLIFLFGWQQLVIGFFFGLVCQITKKERFVNYWLVCPERQFRCSRHEPVCVRPDCILAVMRADFGIEERAPCHCMRHFESLPESPGSLPRNSQCVSDARHYRRGTERAPRYQKFCAKVLNFFGEYFVLFYTLTLEPKF